MGSEWGRRETVDVSGRPVHAAVAGNGRDVVLVHGLGASHRYFRPLADLLSRSAAVAAPDLPGFGWTPGPATALDVRGLSGTLAGWLRVTGRGGSPVVANSLGCQVVVDLATHAPDLLGPVVLVGPTFDRAHRSVPAQMWRLLAASADEDRRLAVVLARDYLVCGPRRFAATLRAGLGDPVEDKVGALPGPTVVVRGGKDRIAPARWVAELVERIPGGRAVEVPGVGHALNWTAPADVAAALAMVSDL